MVLSDPVLCSSKLRQSNSCTSWVQVQGTGMIRHPLTTPVTLEYLQKVLTKKAKASTEEVPYLLDKINGHSGKILTNVPTKVNHPATL